MNDGNLGGQSAHVLVVCTANLARSPVAEVMLGRAVHGSGLSVSSAGVHAREDLPAATMAVRIAAARGLDLSKHRSRAVTPELLMESDLILTMSERQRDHCAGLVAGAGPRTFTLREFVRLLDAAPDSSGPVASTDRLKWLRDQAHAARPVAVRPLGPEDIADPINEPPEVWLQLGNQLDQLIGRIHRAVEGDE